MLNAKSYIQFVRIFDAKAIVFSCPSNDFNVLNNGLASAIRILNEIKTGLYTMVSWKRVIACEEQKEKRGTKMSKSDAIL